MVTAYLVYWLVGSGVPPTVIEMPTLSTCEAVANAVVNMAAGKTIRWTCVQ